MSERVHAKAVVERMQAVFAKSYDMDEVPATPSYPIIVLAIDTSRTASYRMNGGGVGDAWRFVTSYYGTTADEARICAEKARQAFLNYPITVPGHRTTLARRESSQLIIPEKEFDDAGRTLYAGSSVWTFGSMPTA